MSKVLSVAWREFKQTVFRPVFLLAVLGVPILMIGLVIVAGFAVATHEEPPLIGTFAIVDETGAMSEAAEHAFSAEAMDQEHREQIEAMREEMTSPENAMTPGGLGGPTAMPLQRGEVRVTIESLQPEEDAEAQLERIRRRIAQGELIAAAVTPPELLEAAVDDGDEAPARFDLYVATDLDSDHVDLLERRLGQAVVQARAARAGLDLEEVDAMLQRPQASTRRLDEAGAAVQEGEGMRELKRMVPLFFLMLLWIATFTAGQHLLMSTIEEKSNRVMEVLLSAVSPLQLMTGKILGHGGVGLIIMVIYGAAALAGMISFAVMHLIDPLDFLYLVLYFFMAYFMIASLMAAVGSAVTDIREANTLVTPVMLILFVPLMLWLPISMAPNGVIAQAFSFIPPAIPFVMIMRVAADEPVPFWQIPVTLVWGYLCVWFMVWFAAKIFRVGVLMYGKPPSPLELIKWIRYA